MKWFYEKEDIQNYITDEIPLGTIIIIKTKWDTFKGKLTLNNKDCIAIDYPKELKGTYIARDNIEYIKVLGSFSDLINLIKKENDVKMSNKEQLLNELEQIKNQQRGLAEQLEKVQKQIEEENNAKQWWMPENGEEYAYINSYGKIRIEKSNSSTADVWREDNLNIYKTKELAERQAFEELLHRKLKRFAFENNKEEIDWDNCSQMKYCITFQVNKILVGWKNTNKEFGQIYFISEKTAEKAIEEFKDDLIRYFTSDK